MDDPMAQQLVEAEVEMGAEAIRRIPWCTTAMFANADHIARAVLEALFDAEPREESCSLMIHSMKVYRSLAELIQEARRAKDWSREDLAATAGVSFSTVVRAESGKIPRGDALAGIVLALDLDAERVIGLLAQQRGAGL